MCRTETQTAIIEWESNGHNGGEMAFGPDGMLYISSGDGTSDSDTDNTGQDIRDLTSGIVRIDVEHPADGKQYRIPDDNPFLTIPDARGELWAYGFRNPWRLCFDGRTGDLWVGDIGQDIWEMVHVVQRGGNYGWSVMEGSHPFHPLRQPGPTPISPPTIEHHHSESRSITGGLVYYGPQLPGSSRGLSLRRLFDRQDLGRPLPRRQGHLAKGAGRHDAADPGLRRRHGGRSARRSITPGRSTAWCPRRRRMLRPRSFLAS